MARNATLVIELPSDVTASLSRLATVTQRGQSALAADAITDYVTRAEADTTACLSEAEWQVAKERRNAFLREILKEARRRSTGEAFDAARSQDFLYDEDGLPG
ncbi:hypothetical protein [Nitrospirillum sp. BR 11828]|uniref:hypothetical protein n=1 Tax=Nitrospirillum sp. BR 11828 TaxID=3104325 RepID=UPI002ACAEC1C|nr:hypothetical protein [Nitrospirillum sp. BR 11828]MDZ5647526.1 hypothetical protein [Nitrospirillum sp. BR 11828]